MRILIVDNTHGKEGNGVLEYFKIVKKYEVIGVTNARDGWTEITKGKYDVVLIGASEDVVVRGINALSELIAQEFPNTIRVCWSADFRVTENPLIKERYQLALCKLDSFDSLVEEIEKLYQGTKVI